MAWLRNKRGQKEEAPAEKAEKPGLQVADAMHPTAKEQTSDPEVDLASGAGPPMVEPAVPGPGAWKMGLIVTASALCGGIAVVLWNRRLLTKMREVLPGPSDRQGRLWEDDV